MRKCAEAKAQISLRIQAVWSGPSLSESLGTIECMNGKNQRPGWYFEHAQYDLNLRISYMLEGTFFSGCG